MEHPIGFRLSCVPHADRALVYAKFFCNLGLRKTSRKPQFLEFQAFSPSSYFLIIMRFHIDSLKEQ